ncbi:hypothetical protein ONS95_012485 [Cadophora gregata]|uniref:uncharacterized protein n=1 Tax=Cadophora gregata TaxID=51156 RepID=UPI0026DDB027|nr:uncharacterized protein ONS95_012485 [Cadophora gregata]KAK0118180.1 hypothetical protein ONS95_012485 [Cadophora gregata]KAK0123252.1 hypothetical protein ONS96_010251 [Cadophora gregata f. sp. sojae]
MTSNKTKYEIELQRAFDSQIREIEERIRLQGYGTLDWGDIDYDKLPKRPWEVEVDVKTEEQLIKERVEQELTGWPWNDCPQKLLLLGPYALNYAADGGQNIEPRFKLAQVAQHSPLFTKLFSNDVISRKLLQLIFEKHTTAWKFWSTCQEMTQIYDSYLHLWDMTGTLEDGGYFHNCEKPRHGPGAPTDPWDQGTVSPVIVIAPFRRPSGPPSYYEQVRNIYTMSISMSNFAENMQNLQLHRISFLTPQLLNLLIPKMTQLRVLGIYQCQLMHVAEIIRLLEIIKTDRPLGRENQISLDFYPMWHQGPEPYINGKEWNPAFTGTYGATWDNTDMNTPLAVWSIVLRALPMARTQNVDIVSKESAFRQWLDKGLLWKVEETLQALQNPNTDPRVICALVDSRNPDHHGNVRRWASDNIGCRPEGWKPYTLKYPCNYCKQQVLGIFFKFHDIFELQSFHGNSARQANLTCLGCKLKIACQHEKDHYKPSKRRLMKAWLQDGDDGWNTADLSKALSDFHTRRIILKADALDEKRMHAMNRTDPNKNYDAEYGCRQEPVPWEAYGKHGSQKRSPTADIPEEKESSQWSRHNMDNRNAHFRC